MIDAGTTDSLHRGRRPSKNALRGLPDALAPHHRIELTTGDVFCSIIGCVKRKAGPNVPALAREEWDFASIPDDELEACFLTEYFREVPDWVRDVQKPFQSLTAGEKKKKIAAYQNGGLNARDQFKWVQLEETAGYVTLRPQNRLLLLDDPDESRILGDFMINWDQPDTSILREFANWLKKHRPNATLSDRRGVKLNSLRVYLDRLGVMRLLHHHRPSELRKMSDAWRFLTQREYHKERKRARDVFAQLFPPKYNEHLVPVSWPTKSGKSK
jgi:hypothetical protein